MNTEEEIKPIVEDAVADFYTSGIIGDAVLVSEFIWRTHLGYQPVFLVQQKLSLAARIFGDIASPYIN